MAAVKSNMVNGTSETTFSPNDTITREQMAAIIGRKLDITSETELSYSDKALIEDYALPYVSALTEKKYLSGTDQNMFMPKATATRAEAATLLGRVLIDVKPKDESEPVSEPDEEANDEQTDNHEEIIDDPVPITDPVVETE